MKYKYVTRIDSFNTHGWWVRISRYKKRRQKFFADLKHGSKDYALMQALIYVDKVIEELEKTSTSIARLKKLKTGMQGRTIARMRKYCPKAGKNAGQDHYVVSWGSGKDRVIRTFSINKYGEKGAHDQAKALMNAVNRELEKKYTGKK